MSETEPIDRHLSIIAIDAINEIVYIAITGLPIARRLVCADGGMTEIAMSDLILPKPPGRARGRPFEKGRSGNPGGRRTGSLNKTTAAAAALLAGESEALTRKAV